MQAVIGYTNYYIPANSLTTDEYVAQLSEEFLKHLEMSRQDLAAILKNSIGIDRIYLDDRKNESKIFWGMLEQYFAESDTSPEDIDYLIYTRGNSVAIGDPWSVTDDHCINVPYFLQHKFGMKKAQIFNVEQVCSGTLVAARIAKSFIQDGSAKKILVLSANFFRSMENRLMGGLGLVSDAVGVMEISADDEGLELVDFMGETDGNITMVKDFRRGTHPATIVNVGTELMKNLLAKNNLTFDDIAVLIPQNISNSGWNFYCQMLGYPKEKVFLETFRDGGHMADVDIIRNLTEVNRKGLMVPGDNALIYGIGTGTSWTTVLLKKVL